MTRKNQSYSKEFKAEAVRTVFENQFSISEGASLLSVPEGTLGQWVTAAIYQVVIFLIPPGMLRVSLL